MCVFVYGLAATTSRLIRLRITMRSAFSRTPLGHTDTSADYISGTFRDLDHPRSGLGFGCPSRPNGWLCL